MLGTSPFTYDQLNEEAAQIRLIRLHGLTKRQKLQTRCHGRPLLSCALEHRSLDEVPGLRFSALSYTWGPEAPLYTILINGATFQIRQNLYRFLVVAASKPGLRELPIWIDQISINQSSNEERKKQVALMERIYSEAVQVFMWLGPSTLVQGLTFDVLCRDRLAVWVLESWARSSWRTNLRWIPLWTGLHSVLSSPYWTRLWIIQEVLLGTQTTRLVLCGHRQVSWPRFKALVGKPLYDADESLGLKNADELWLKGGQATGRLRGTWWSIHYGALRQVVSTSHRLGDLFPRGMSKPAEGLLDLVCTYLTYKCSEPHDHVYGLMGLAPAPSRLDANYDVPLLQVLCNVLEASFSNITADDSSLSRMHAAVDTLDTEYAGAKVYTSLFGRGSAEGNVWVLIVEGNLRLHALYEYMQAIGITAAELARTDNSDYGEVFNAMAERPELTCNSVRHMLAYILNAVPRGVEILSAFVTYASKVQLSMVPGDELFVESLGSEVVRSWKIAFARISRVWHLKVDQESSAWGLGFVEHDGPQDARWNFNCEGLAEQLMARLYESGVIERIREGRSSRTSQSEADEGAWLPYTDPWLSRVSAEHNVRTRTPSGSSSR